MSKGNVMVFEGPGTAMKCMSLNVPQPGPGEVLVKNRYTTICGSDLHTYCGTRKEALPTVLGHEIVGEIVAFSDDHIRIDQKGESLNIGDIVTWSIFSSDPGSYYALEGIPQKADHLFKYGHALVEGQDAFHGGLADYCVLKKGTAILKVPDSVPLPIAATINCAIATVAGGVRLAGAITNKNVLIFGTGLLGLTCAAMCRDAGAAHITVVDINEDRLQQAASFGADNCILMNTNTVTQLQKLITEYSRQGYDLVFDMSGSADAMELGLQFMAIGATAIWIGAVFKTRDIRVNAEKLIRNLLTIKGLHNYNHEDFVEALNFIVRSWNKYPFADVVDQSFSLGNVEDAFQYALTHKPLRVGVSI